MGVQTSLLAIIGVPRRSSAREGLSYAGDVGSYLIIRLCDMDLEDPKVTAINYLCL